MTLAPMRRFGSATELNTYAVRDFVGVQADTVDPGTITDHRGINEVFAWSRLHHATVTAEHFENGVHNAQRIARAFVVARWDAVANNWACGFESYIQTTAGAVTTGTGVASFSRSGTGVGSCTLAQSMASTDMGFMPVVLPDRQTVHVTGISTDKVFAFRVAKRAAADVAFAAVDGDFILQVFA